MTDAEKTYEFELFFFRKRLMGEEAPPPKKVDVVTQVSGKRAAVSIAKKGKLARSSPAKSESLKGSKDTKEKERKITEKKSKSSRTSKASDASKDSTRKGKFKGGLKQSLLRFVSI